MTGPRAALIVSLSFFFIVIGCVFYLGTVPDSTESRQAWVWASYRFNQHLEQEGSARAWVSGIEPIFWDADHQDLGGLVIRVSNDWYYAGSLERLQNAEIFFRWWRQAAPPCPLPHIEFRDKEGNRFGLIDHSGFDYP